MLAVNGEIYNHRDIRARYAGKYAFQTGSDCEVILALFLRKHDSQRGAAHSDQPCSRSRSSGCPDSVLGCDLAVVFRSKVISYLRQKMTDMGFLEIQTPILCASSPEGARDYIVPSRKFKGKFYALPQAPQQYKQLLMASGFDKYFQIAPCFRDEDARADRSPGEFYQLDFEMSFVTQEDVFKVGEEVLHDTFVKFAPEGSRITETPFPIISYKQAMLEFGCDKPDLRNPLRIMDVTEFFQSCTFKPFIGRTVRAIKVHAEMSKGFHEKLLSFATSLGMGGLGYLEVAEDMSYKGPIDKFIPEEMKGELAEMAGLSAGDTIFFIADKEDKANYYAGHIRTELGEKLRRNTFSQMPGVPSAHL